MDGYRKFAVHGWIPPVECDVMSLTVIVTVTDYTVNGWALFGRNNREHLENFDIKREKQVA
ncbi:hypothetical protein GCM10008018_35350 [Paenibacillus marchantiophytorum]|uniref:Uncharacterized protein n=1 Tax=Paenibacillus marchantiophytorum TaxID=1619310 RepID=A0ABQ1EU98_9BACL|nr:hypothetical protein GCM10008018_35350 [Paenibacillus marchantiophytorum]